MKGPHTDQNPLLFITKRKRKMTGKRLETFNQFWEVFNYKRGKAEAGDAWLDIPLLTDKIVEDILLAARKENSRRQRLLDANRTPKMAQGWITARRWEDDYGDVDVKPAKQQNLPPIEKMHRAYQILCEDGKIKKGKFHDYCYLNKMPPGDIEAVMNKYNMVYDTDKLTQGIG
jgi:hypothetical protein